ncbi:hypothetical protein RB595_005127 [Gaeumannomyces hyphopodioides]
MSEKGNGGIDGGCVGHTRAKSDGDAVPTTEPTVDTRTTAAQTPSEPESEFAQNSQQKLRYEDRSVARQQDLSSPATLPAPLSRNPSNRSTSSTSSESQDRRHHRSMRVYEPPVTKATLSELDVNKIIHNPKLRHDINFDPDLHFRPNLDGEKGRKKQQRANEFWECLSLQLALFVTDRETFVQRYGEDSDWCLPRLLKAVKEIIQTLVPARDRDFLDEGLNVELLIQQFNRGIADLEKLASWLSSVLKLHCAPMRDEWVDEMYRELSKGNRNNDIGLLVQGMRSLLSVLEAMKLDVANHQIRCLRPVLIEDTAHFQQRFFHKKLQARSKVDTVRARIWYRDADRQYSALDTPSDMQQGLGDMAGFFYAISRLILPSAALDYSDGTYRFPGTFLFDNDRLEKLSSDAADAICLDMCMKLYDDLERVSRIAQAMPTPFGSSLLPPTSVPSYVLDDDSSSRSRSNRSSINFDFNTSPSRPSSLVGSATSSPRTSACIFTPAPSNPALDSADARARSKKVYASLVDLVQTASPASSAARRWRGLVPDVALQILRSTEAPLDMLPTVERKLDSWLSNCQSEQFQEAEQAFHSKLFAELAGRVREYKNLSGLGLFSAATGSRLHSGPGGIVATSSSSREGASGAAQPPPFLQLDRGGSGRSTSAREEHGVESMATRLAHLGILHWRVWADITYRTPEPETDDPADVTMSDS